MKKKQKVLVDKGFDSDFSIERIKKFHEIFTDEDEMQEFVYKIHEEDNTLDMKRGEFYPEILRCIVSMKRAIADAYKITPLQCHPNFGSNGSIDTILAAMKIREVNRKINPEHEGGMLVATPTYFRNYNSSAAKQIKMVKVPLKMPDWNFNLDLFLEKMVEKKPTVIFLVTPNNPTGLEIPDDAIVKVIENANEDTLVVMDRTLVNIKPEISTVELLSSYKHKNLAILHSFSKYRGMSHLRVGFAVYSNEKIAEEIRPHLPLGLGVEGAIKATYMLKNGPITPSDKIIYNIKESKKILVDFCEQSGKFSCTDFVGNYCLLILPDNISSEQLVLSLEQKGIYVMGGTEAPDSQNNVVRIHTGGKPEFMMRTVEAMNELFS
jgi:histidinol-phosphate/aromatic aminotransferase/cobyric acid decarboxylase-like protein